VAIIADHFFFFYPRGKGRFLSHGCDPAELGGDHTLRLANLRARRLQKKTRACRHLIHVDAHSDTNDEMFRRERGPMAVRSGRAGRKAVSRNDRCSRLVCGGTGYSKELISMWGGNRAGPASGRRMLAQIADAIDGGTPRQRFRDATFYLTYDIDRP